MRFSYNPDQATLAGFLGQMLNADESAFRVAPDWGRYEYGAALDRLLEENGFYDAAAEASLGRTMAADLIFQVARRPVVVECAASALLRPLLAPDLERPVAVLTGSGKEPVRFLPMARSAIWLGSDTVRTATLVSSAIAPVESLFAYPMGIVDPRALNWIEGDCDPRAAADLWRIAIAAEIAGALSGALDAVLEHVRQREQFDRPLGSFQGVQHRLATASVRIEGTRLLALHAAQTGAPRDAAAALGYAQSIATAIGYDLHQFMGAMGLTLEHPLHRWTYRVRLLRSDFGSASETLQDLATQRWGQS